MDSEHDRPCLLQRTEAGPRGTRARAVLLAAVPQEPRLRRGAIRARLRPVRAASPGRARHRARALRTTPRRDEERAPAVGRHRGERDRGAPRPRRPAAARRRPRVHGAVDPGDRALVAERRMARTDRAPARAPAGRRATAVAQRAARTEGRMTRLRTARDDGRRPTPSRWIDLGGRGKCKTWQLAGTRYFVKHCGHPTANYPWYGERPDGSIITSGKDGRCGMALRYLDDAKVAAELDHAGRPGAIALTAAQRSSDSAGAAQLTPSRPSRRSAAASATHTKLPRRSHHA